MRTFVLTLCLVVLTASPGAAFARRGGGGNINLRLGTLRITNQCDDAVAVSVNGGTAVTLEPGASTTRLFGFATSVNPSTETVQASLVSDPSVSASKKCTVRVGKTTNVGITSSIGRSGQVVLSLTVK